MRRFALSSLKAHRGRLALTIIAIALSVSFVTASFVLADSLRSVFSEVSSQIYEDVDASVRSGEGDFDQLASGDRFDQSELAVIGDVSGISDVVPGLGAEFTLFTVDEAGEPLLPQGPPVLNFSVTGDRSNPTALPGASPFTLITGTVPDSDQILLDTAQARVLDVVIGDEVIVATPSGPETFTLSGTVVFGEDETGVSPYFLLFELSTIQDLLGATDQIDSAALLFDDGVDPAAVIAAVEQALPESLFVTDQAGLIAEQSGEFGELIDVIQAGLLVFAAITTFVAVFVIANTFAVLVGQRTRQLGLLRALGATTRQAGSAVLVEAALVGTIASAVGLGFGLLVAQGIKVLFESVTTGGFPEGPLELAPRTVMIAAVVGIGVTLVSALVPARRAARLTPMQALEEAPVSLAERSWMSRVLGLVAWPLRAVGGSSARLAATNLQRNPRRVLSTAMSMIIGLALITAMSVMAASYKSTITESMSSDFDADLIITPSDGGTVPFAAVEAVAGLAGVDAASGFGTSEVLYEGNVIELASFQSATAGSVLDLGVEAGSLDDVSVTNSAVSTEFADEHGLDLGDTVVVEFSDGAVVATRISAVFSDESIVTSGVLVDESITAAHARNADASLGAVRFVDGASDDAARTQVETLLESYPQVEHQSVHDFLASRQALVDQLLVLANALLGLTVLIAMSGIANTVALSVIERTHEIGLLRSVGMSRRQLRSMIRYEALITAVVGAITGALLGIGLAAIVSPLMPSNLISQLEIPVTTVAIYVAVAVALGSFAALIPALRASRLNLVASMRA